MLHHEISLDERGAFFRDVLVGLFRKSVLSGGDTEGNIAAGIPDPIPALWGCPFLSLELNGRKGN
jgi:hypothetical protein